MQALNRQSETNFLSENFINDHVIFFTESPESDLDSSNPKHNDSHVSGISPFLSAEDIVVQVNRLQVSNI